MTAGGLNPTLVVQHLVKDGFDVHVHPRKPGGQGRDHPPPRRKLGWVNALGQLGTMWQPAFCAASPTAASKNC